MHIQLHRLASFSPDLHPAYVAADIQQAVRVAEILGTNSSILTRQDVDRLGSMAAKGDFNMRREFDTVTFLHPDPPTKQATHNQ